MKYCYSFLVLIYILACSPKIKTKIISDPKISFEESILEIDGCEDNKDIINSDSKLTMHQIYNISRLLGDTLPYVFETNYLEKDRFRRIGYSIKNCKDKICAYNKLFNHLLENFQFSHIDSIFTFNEYSLEVVDYNLLIPISKNHGTSYDSGGDFYGINYIKMKGYTLEDLSVDIDVGLGPYSKLISCPLEDERYEFELFFKNGFNLEELKNELYKYGLRLRLSKAYDSPVKFFKQKNDIHFIKSKMNKAQLVFHGVYSI